MMYLGDFAEDQTVRFHWGTTAIAGESITRATNGTISVYKDGNTTQTTTGVTDTEDFDSLTGVHYCEIATTDAFYVAGSEYTVILSGATIDGKSINTPLAHFSIERTGGALALLKNTTYGLSAAKTVQDAIKAKTDNLPSDPADASVIAGRFDTLDTNLATVDTVVDAVLEDTGTTLPATLSTIAQYIDTEVGAIKAKTDSLTFTVAGQVDANIQYVNDVPVNGTGATGDEWGP